MFDPHHDHLTGASFAVSAAGVQQDATIFNDTSQDQSWDAVWHSAVDGRRVRLVARDAHPVLAAAVSLGRSPDVRRSTPCATSSARRSRPGWFTCRRPRAAWRRGWGISRGWTACRRTGPSSSCRTRSAARRSSSASHRRIRSTTALAAFAGAGLDLKYRVSSNLSLDGTINPDFGQVEVDPAVVNLTAFETFFEEKRPFFIEGANIFSNFGQTGANNFWGFNRAEPIVFYSRRIGRSPQGDANGDFVDAPTATTILGAAKLTGKTRKRLEPRPARCGDRPRAGGDGHRPRQRDARRSSRSRTTSSAARSARSRKRAGIGVLATAVNRDLSAPVAARRAPGSGLRCRRRRPLTSSMPSATG